MPRYFYDTEFIEDGQTIDLISIGIVCEDGRELYLQSVEFEPKKANQWVQEHVLSSLTVCPHLSENCRGLYAHEQGQCTFEKSARGITGFSSLKMTGYLTGVYEDCPWRTREQIKNEILAFMDVAKYGKPELWAYYADYDHVAFCQLFGTMMDLPKGFPMYTQDIKQFCDMTGNPRLPDQGKGEHNALADARWNNQAWDFLYSRAQELNDHVARVLESRAMTEYQEGTHAR